MAERLMRTQNARMIGGVCGGLGRYLKIDPVLIRLAFVLFTLAGGAGLLVYLILLIVMPLDTKGGSVVNYMPASAEERQQRTKILVGGGLILVGVWYLMGQIPGLGWLSFGALWPLLLIVIGVAMIVGFMQGKEV